MGTLRDAAVEDYVVNMRRDEVERGILRINSEVFDSVSMLWLQEIDKIRDSGVKDVTVKITSPGGSAYYAIALYDALNELRAGGVKITARVEGYAASAAAAFILQASDWRTAGKSSRILIHEVRGAMGGRISDMEDERSEMQAIDDLMLEILEKRTGHDAEFWRSKVRRREKWFDAEEALELNLIDEIR